MSTPHSPSPSPSPSRQWQQMLDAAHKSWQAEGALGKRHSCDSHFSDEENNAGNAGQPHRASLDASNEPGAEGDKDKDKDKGEDEPDMQGTLAKRGGRVKTWKSRFVVVKNGVVRYFATEEAFRLNAQPRGAFRIKEGWQAHAGLKGQDSGTQGFFFCAGPTGADAEHKRCWVFAARTAAERDEWTEFFRHAIHSLSGTPKTSLASAHHQPASSLALVRREGLLYKRGLSYQSWKHRFVVLEGDEVRYFSSPGASARQLPPRGGFRLEPSWSVCGGVDGKNFDPKLGFLFSVGPSATERSRVWVFGAASENERDNWMAAFTKAIRLLD